MKGFLQEYGIIMVVVAVVLGMLAFGKTGYAKSIQDAILGSADHIVETGENITKSDKKEVNVKVGDLLTIEGQNYIVLESNGNNALVMTFNKIESRAFQSVRRSDNQNQNTYEDSEIDDYLALEWYNSLSNKMQSAIQGTSIKQVTYDRDKHKQEIGYNGQIFNTINRYVFLPSVSEISKVVDLNNVDKVKEFTDNSYMWTRDSASYDNSYVMYIDGVYTNWGCLRTNSASTTYIGVRPTFTIDLSQVDYTEAGHVMYK